MIYARLISFHPAEGDEPEEHFDITFPVGMSFARTATDANARILAFLERTEDFAVPRADDSFPVWVWSEVVTTVVVWEG